MFPKHPSLNFSVDYIFDFAPHPMWIYDVSTLRFLRVNREAIRVYGFTNEEFLSLTLKDIRPEEDVPILMEAIKHIYQRDDDYFKRSFVRHKKKNGTVFPVLIKSNLIPHKELTIEMVTAIDISEQKRSEDLLKQSNRRLKHIQKIAKLGYWRRDVNSDLSDWSEETYRIFGRKPHAFEPTLENVINAFHPEDRYLLTDDLLDHLQPDKFISFEHRIQRADGSIRWVHQEIQLIPDNSGEPLYIEGIIQDITNQKEYESRLEISNKRFAMAMLASDQKIWELDHTRNTILHSMIINAGQEQIIEEPFGKDSSWCNKIHPDDIDWIWESFHEHLCDTEITSGKLEYRIRKSDGSVGFVTDTYYIQRGEHGVPLKTVGCMTDVTVGRKQLERIKDQNKALRDIAWHQSHTIRSPLTRIMALLNLYKSNEGELLSFDRLLTLIDEAVIEIDTEIHKIVKITHTNNQKDERNITDR